MDRLISEKEAIEAINDYWGEMETPTIDGYINAIKTIPSAEPSGDLISKQEVLDLIADYDLSMGQVVRSIHTLPSVKLQEPKTGHWVRWYEIIEEENCTIHDPHCKCSECDKEYDPYTSQFIKYCSNCGAKMIAESEVQDENNAGTR